MIEVLTAFCIGQFIINIILSMKIESQKKDLELLKDNVFNVLSKHKRRIDRNAADFESLNIKCLNYVKRNDENNEVYEEGLFNALKSIEKLEKTCRKIKK